MESITAIVETPKGQGLKYDFDPLLGCFRLNKVMPPGLVFPFDFGYIPGTMGGDGDPVDVLIISELQTFSGCAVDCRIIGGIKANQKERDGSLMRNDRIIVVPEVSIQYSAVNKLSDLPAGVLTQLEAFFINYNQQAGKIFTPIDRMTAERAFTIVQKSKTNAQKDTLVQLFIPLLDHQGKPFPKRLYANLNSQLKERFGGLTVYSRAPATGFWKEEDNKTTEDALVIYEVLTTIAENKYFAELQVKLEKQFAQQELLILMSKVRKL